MREEVGGRLDQIAGRREIERALARRRRMRGRTPAGLRPARTLTALSRSRRSRRVVRGEHAGRERRIVAPTAPASAKRVAEHALDRLARQAAGPQQRRIAPRQETIVDSTPTLVGPPSTIRSMRPSRSARTCAAVVGETWPDRLAEGATTGSPNASSRSRATGWSGTRTAIESSPAVASSDTGQPSALRQHQGQRARARTPPASSFALRRKARERAAPPRASATCAISGLKRGRPLAA